MGTTGTYLFIPFILLVIGFFVFLFYPIIKKEMKETRGRDVHKVQPEQPQSENSIDKT